MKVPWPGALARHHARQEVTTPADESGSDSGGRLLQWVGLVTVAAATGVMITFAAPAPQAQAAPSQATRTTQSAAPSPSSPTPDEQEALRRLKEYVKTQKDTAVNRILKIYLDVSERYPGKTCLAKCLGKEWITSGFTTNPVRLAQIALECSSKCAREVRDELLDKGLRTELERAVAEARAKVNAAKQKANDRTLDPALRKQAQEELTRANIELNEIKRLQSQYGRARSLLDKAGAHRMRAKRAKDEKERAREQRIAGRKDKRGRDLLERSYQERPSARNDSGRAGDAGSRAGDKGDGTGASTSRPKARVPRVLRKIFPWLGLFAFGQGLDDASRDIATLQERIRESTERLKSYIEEHPNEAEQLMSLARQGQLPLLDPEGFDKFLREWDANHDDATGEDTRSLCDIAAQLGSPCSTDDPVSWRDLDSPQDRGEYRSNEYWPGVNQPDRYQREGYRSNGYRPATYQPNQYQPDRYQSDGYRSNASPSQEFRTTSYGTSYKGLDSGTLITEPSASEPTTRSTSASKSKSESKPAKSTKSTTKKADRGGSRRTSTVTSSPRTRTTTPSTTGQRTGNTRVTSTTGSTTRSTTKGKSSSDSTAAARDAALHQLAKEKSDQFQRDAALRQLAREKSSEYLEPILSTRQKA